MVTQLFNTELKQTNERKDNLERLLDPSKVRAWITNEVDNECLAEEGYSGKFTDRLGNYLFKSQDAKSSRKGAYPFYHTEGQYWPKEAPRSAWLTEDVEEMVNCEAYYRKLNENHDDYLKRLFRPENMTIDFFRNFIKAGLLDDHADIYQSDDLELLWHLRSIRELILKSCKSNADLIFLKFFDGKNSVSQAAKLMGVRHQNASKRLKKICKNAQIMGAKSK
ncbi:hypothetical protein [Limosilactobacillus fermentum]|uniref:hypothetical protein n=1 Tax=Limosilactobacillus fermentum TaxID=1613 RepID=UPI001E54676F|nr:hypothetical protein [Limosilactobacillus fermentum]MCD5423010.1 hypothetical protein [Limosilactobacillus fermentum]